MSNHYVKCQKLDCSSPAVHFWLIKSIMHFQAYCEAHNPGDINVYGIPVVRVSEQEYIASEIMEG